jgi:hypothetical protein
MASRQEKPIRQFNESATQRHSHQKHAIGAGVTAVQGRLP